MFAEENRAKSLASARYANLAKVARATLQNAEMAGRNPQTSLGKVSRAIRSIYEFLKNSPEQDTSEYQPHLAPLYAELTMKESKIKGGLRN